MANARDFMKGDFKRTDCKSALSGYKALIFLGYLHLLCIPHHFITTIKEKLLVAKNKEIAIIAISYIFMKVLIQTLNDFFNLCSILIYTMSNKISTLVPLFYVLM